MKPRCLIMIAIIVIVAIIAAYFIIKQQAVAPNGPAESTVLVGSDQPVITANEALAVVQNSDCLKDGITIKESGEIFYNPTSKTWWFDLEADKAGCSPACVVSENKTAEINWRCTGLIVSDESDKNAIREILVAKYPKYAKTISISFTKKTDNYARGGIGFAPGGTGGIFLAAKVDGSWQVVYDGNGAISCSLAKYGFPSDMLSDCS